MRVLKVPDSPLTLIQNHLHDSFPVLNTTQNVRIFHRATRGDMMSEIYLHVPYFIFVTSARSWNGFLPVHSRSRRT